MDFNELRKFTAKNNYRIVAVNMGRFILFLNDENRPVSLTMSQYRKQAKALSVSCQAV